MIRTQTRSKRSAPAEFSLAVRRVSVGLAMFIGAQAALAGDLDLASPKPRPVDAPSGDEIRAAIELGRSFLLERQNPDGSWGSARRTKGLNIYAPAPGAHQAFRAAVTSLAVSALVETGADDPRVRSALERAERYLLTKLPRVRRATPDAIYNVWTHAYSLSAIAKLFALRDGDSSRQEKLRELAESQVELLERYESVDGGWGYYDFRVGTRKPSSSSIGFTSATVLVAFKEIGTAAKVEAPARLVQRAVDSILRQRKSDFSYVYGEYLKLRPMRGINRRAGSLGRSQACNFALRLWGDETVTDAVIEEWLDRLFARNLWLDIGRKRPIPHESWFQVAGYFYYYGHYYAALGLELLPADRRARHQTQLARILIDRQEKDGSWWDFPFYDYHQPYGTAFALMSLERCRADR